MPCDEAAYVVKPPRVPTPPPEKKEEKKEEKKDDKKKDGKKMGYDGQVARATIW